MIPNGQYGGGGYGGGNGGGDMTIGDIANGAPNIRLSQIPASFARQLPWMLLASAVLIPACWWFTKDIKREYTAEGRILVQLGSEYVYNPASGVAAPNNGGSVMMTPDSIVATEIGIIKNTTITDLVVNEMIASPSSGGVGGERFAPELYERWVNAPPGEETDRWNDIIKFVDKSYIVMPTPKSSIVNLVYKHEDGDVAVQTLDKMITEYQRFRKDKFVSETSGQIAERKSATEEQLADVERKIQSILNRNDISDFGTEQVGAQKRAEDLRANLNGVIAGLAAAEASLAVTEDQLRSTPPTINLYVDDRGPARLAQLRLERRQLLAKYLPGSNPVRAKEAEISEVEAQVNLNGGQPTGGRRVGPNVTYQALMTQLNKDKSLANSLSEQESVLQNQLNVAASKVKTLRQLGPEYKNLIREKTTLETKLAGLNAKEQEAQINQQQQEANSENIKVITRPSMPRKGRNMSKIMFVLSSAAALFTIFMLALLRVFLDPKLYGPAPGSRLPASSHGAGYGAAREVLPQSYENIPEPVPAYVPPADPAAPAYEPAYAPAAYEPQPYQPQAYDQTAYSGQQAQPYGEPAYNAPAYEGSQMYADGTIAPNPYATAAPAPAHQPAHTPFAQAQEYAGADGALPVLGHTQTDPNPG